MTGVWDPTKAVTDVQFGGPGNPWLVWGIQGQTIPVGATGASGGGRSITERFARNVNSGLLERVARLTDGDPEPYTFDLKKRLSIADWRQSDLIRKFDCAHSVRMRQGCGNYTDRSAFTFALLYDDARRVGGNIDGDVVAGTTDQAADVMRVINESAGDEILLRNVNHLDISGSVSDFDLNKIRSLGVFRCGGDCGDFQDGTELYIAVSDADSTPGYLSQPNPKWYITADGGATFGYSGQIDAVAGANALDVVRVGAYVIVAVNGAGGGVAYARYQDLIDGIIPAWMLASGIVNASGSPKALAVADGQTVFAAGTNGYIYKSTDGGLTFTVLSAGAQTAQTINSAAFADVNLGYFGANASVLLKYDSGVVTTLTLPAGVTGNINVVAIPDPVRRGNEVYIGTSTGQIWRNKQAGRAGQWTQLAFTNSGAGAITDMGFSGNGGQILYVVQTAANNTSRILRDLSGGAMGVDVVVVGGYTDPANFGINSIAVAQSSINDALTVGQIHQTYAMIGKIA